MRFDDEGHLHVSPREIQELAFDQRPKLINSVLLPGTPLAIPTHQQHCILLEHFASTLGLHPRCLFFRGSTKIGFSIAPRPDKVWMAYGDESDLDLAIVDANYFHIVESQIGRWERDPQNRRPFIQENKAIKSHKSRIRQKGQFNCYRYFDLPPIECMRQLTQCIELAPRQDCCGLPRGLTAFVFRDWWGVYERYDHDLDELCEGLRRAASPLPPGGNEPRPHRESTGDE